VSTPGHGIGMSTNAQQALVAGPDHHHPDTGGEAAGDDHDRAAQG
jgi:hypothetical protein